MKLHILITVLVCSACGCTPGEKGPVDGDAVRSALAGRPGGFVIMDAESNQTQRVSEAHCAKRFPPCSTFKIWNTMIALELGLVSSPEEPFYTWDGQKRAIEDWNRDLTLGRAFAVSCVPAFQSLAGRIGAGRMQDWLDRIGYGNRDISAGVTDFWLPRPNQKSILISADEQAALLRRLVRWELPFSEKKVSVLREIMRVRATAKGALFGKTGTGELAGEHDQVAWFVGWVESPTGKKIHTFACVARGDRLRGPDVRAMVETILASAGLL